MEQEIILESPKKKIYKDRAIWVGTFLGGPLVAGYLIAENFKVFNEPEKVKKIWIFSIIATVIIFGGIFLIPENVKIPNQIIPLLYTVITYYLVQHFQGYNITTHIGSGGQLFGWWRTIGIGFTGLAITIIPIFGIVLIYENATSIPISTKTYGIMKHQIDFDKSNITETEINKIADAFTKTTFFDKAVTKYVFAKKVNNTYELSISVVAGIENDIQAIQPFIGLRTDMQVLLPDNKIVFNLVVENLDNVVKRLE